MKERSERLGFKVTKELVDELRQAALEEDVTMTTFVVEALREALAKRRTNQGSQDNDKLKNVEKRLETLEELLIRQTVAS